jgi:hypothetical protein
MFTLQVKSAQLVVAGRFAQQKAPFSFLGMGLMGCLEITSIAIARPHSAGK